MLKAETKLSSLQEEWFHYSFNSSARVSAKIPVFIADQGWDWVCQSKKLSVTAS